MWKHVVILHISVNRLGFIVKDSFGSPGDELADH